MATPTNLPAAVATGDIGTAAQFNNLRGAFRILQVVQASTNVIVASSSATWVDTNLAASITPQASSSRVFVLVNQHLYIDTANTEMGHRLVRQLPSPNTVLQSFLAPVFNSNGRGVGCSSFMFLDSPNSTSALTYSTQINRFSGSGIVYANINNNFATITLCEVSA